MCALAFQAGDSLRDLCAVTDEGGADDSSGIPPNTAYGSKHREEID